MNLLKYLYGVGFEPTRPKPADLKSAPLNHSGNRTDISSTYYIMEYFFKRVYRKLLYYKRFYCILLYYEIYDTKINYLKSCCQNL